MAPASVCALEQTSEAPSSGPLLLPLLLRSPQSLEFLWALQTARFDSPADTELRSETESAAPKLEPNMIMSGWFPTGGD